MGKAGPEDLTREPKTSEEPEVLGGGTEIPLGGEGVLNAVADHTPDTFRKAKAEKPLLDD